MRIFLITLCLILPIVAQPIGRSGNGKLAGVEDGFVTTLPDQLPDIQAGADGSVRMMNPNVMNGMEGPPVLFAHRFAIFYPTRAKMDRDTLKLEFAANGWRPEGLAQDSCVDLYYSDRGSASAVVAVWGAGKGVVFVGSRSGFTTYSIDLMIKNLQLTPGACAWK